MSAFETKGGANKQLMPADGYPGANPSPEVGSLPVFRMFAAALGVALAAGLVGWSLSDRLRVAEVVDLDDFYGGAELSLTLATRNAAVNYSILGAMLSLGMGVSAGLLGGRRSVSRVFLAGLTGVGLGACGGAASSYGLCPIYFNRMETADLTLSMLIHLGIWSAVGVAAGVAFAIGTGSRARFVQSLFGGIVGAALGTALFDISGAFFPLAHTERPLAETAGTRLSANMILSFCVAVGIVLVASQKPRVKTKT